MRFSITGRPSTDTIYAQVQRGTDGNVWNEAGSAWVTRSSNTAGSYLTCAWDATDLQHAGTFSANLAHPSLTPGEYTVLFYKRVGGSPNLSNDLLVSATGLTLQAGESTLLIGSGVMVEFGGAIDGSDISLQAWLTLNGETVELSTVDPTAECDIVVIEQTSAVELLNETSSTITADEHFEITVEDAVDETNADKNYFARVTITVLSVPYTREFPLATAG